MNPRIEQYVRSQFAGAPQKRAVQEFEEELLANMDEKYRDLVAGGMGEDEAFKGVVEDVGDLEGLIGELAHTGKVSFAEPQTARQKRALLVAIAVGLYIVAGMALIFLSEHGDEVVGLMAAMGISAAATGIIIYSNSYRSPKYKREDDSFVEEYKERISMPSKNMRMMSALSSTLWTVIVIAYFILSFWTNRWDITWVIFPVGAVLQQVIRVLFSEDGNYHRMVGGIIWTSALVLYLLMSFTLNNWGTSWIIFLVALAVQQVVRLVRIWREP